MASGPIFPRMLRAAKVESQLYEEVEADAGGTGQALTVVIMASLATGLGSGISSLMQGDSEGGVMAFIMSLVIGIVGALIVWFIFSLLTFWLGTSIFKGPDTKSTLGELLRTLGFADSPGVLNVFSFIPFVGPFIPIVTWIWTVIASVVAVRQACDFSTGRAIGTVLIAALIPLVIMILISMLVAGAFGALLGAGS